MNYLRTCAGALLVSFVLKIGVSFFDYSGKGNPPMFGDYEAQRHWMEITFNLPVKEWYVQTPRNNLTYWGLDYPPLTAYHSWLLGSIANIVNADFVKLHESQGFESSGHKIFMRTTVLISDLFIFSLGLCVYGTRARRLCKDGGPVCKKLLYCALAFPGLILIDHGHFQYNTISLGLSLLAVVCLIQGHDTLCAALFCLSFCYKQMALYYSFPFFFYYLGSFVKESRSSILDAVTRLARVGATVIVSLAIVWAPFISDHNLLRSVLRRIFPLGRGIFEDKVANAWCIVNIFIKLKSIPQETVALACVFVTLLACFPSSLNLFLNPDKDRFLYSLVNCSLAFFLFSYQVHEKTILFVALPVCLILCHRPVHCSWFLYIATLSMWPLLFRDGLMVPTLAAVAVHSVFSVWFYSSLSPKAFEKELVLPIISGWPQLSYAIYLCSLLVQPTLIFLSLTEPPPAHLPHLYPLLISAFSALMFLYFFLYFNYCQIIQLGSSKSSKHSGKSKKFR